MVNGTCEDDWDSVQSLAGRDSRLIPSFGLHPWFVNSRSPEWFQTLSAKISAHSACGVGEIGLDRWMKGFDLPAQESAFRAQLNLADENQRPVTVHCLKAWGLLLEMLQSSDRPDRGFLLHSYGGPAEMISQFVELGAYFSISGYFAHPRKASASAVFRQVPPDRLLVESDAPDMLGPETLQPFKLPDARLNHPANIVAVYRFAAELLGKSEEQFASRVEQNFCDFFGVRQ